MKLKLYMMSALLSIGLMSGVANAAYVQIAPPQANDGEVVIGTDTITYSPFANVASIWNSNTVSPQDADSVKDSITDQFGGTLSLVGQNDSFGGGPLTSNPFNILAIHYGGQGGGNEVLFFFNTLMTAFDVEIAPHEVSNFRAFTGSGGTIPPIAGNQVPVPAAVWLFGSGLLGLIGAARKKSAAA
jgi:ABC-type amino acid transport substrate-binding protein